MGCSGLFEAALGCSGLLCVAMGLQSLGWAGCSGLVWTAWAGLAALGLRWPLGRFLDRSGAPARACACEIALGGAVKAASAATVACEKVAIGSVSSEHSAPTSGHASPRRT